MRALVTVNAQAKQSSVDAAMGYPRTSTDADRKGRGPWMPHEACKTEHYAPVVGHPTNGSVALVVDAAVENHPSALSVADKLAITTINWATQPAAVIEEVEAKII